MGCFGSAAAKTDHDDAKKGKETNKKINQQLQKDKQVYRATHRLLLLGESRWFLIFYPLHFFSFGCSSSFSCSPYPRVVPCLARRHHFPRHNFSFSIGVPPSLSLQLSDAPLLGTRRSFKRFSMSPVCHKFSVPKIHCT